MERVLLMSFVVDGKVYSFCTDCAWQLLDLCLQNASVAAFQLLYPLVRKASSAFCEVSLKSLTAFT